MHCSVTVVLWWGSVKAFNVEYCRCRRYLTLPFDSNLEGRSSVLTLPGLSVHQRDAPISDWALQDDRNRSICIFQNACILLGKPDLPLQYLPRVQSKGLYWMYLSGLGQIGLCPEESNSVTLGYLPHRQDLKIATSPHLLSSLAPTATTAGTRRD